MGRLGPAVLFCFLVAAVPSGAADNAPRAVLLLCQSGLGVEGPGFATALRAFRATLAGGPPVRVYVEGVDFKYFDGEAYGAAIKSYLHSKYSDTVINILVTLGPSAFRFGLKLRSEFWPDAPIVVAAVDDLSVADAAGDAVEMNVTGRTLQLSLARSVEVARMLVPDLKQVALLGDALARQPIRRGFAKELAEVRKDLSVLDLTGQPRNDVVRRLGALPQESAIIYTTATNDGAGRDLFSNEMAEIIAAESKQPIVVDIDNRLGHGGTGGFVARNEIIGREAAEVVLRLFQGETASQIPLTRSDAVQLTFDWRELKRLGISDSVLPSNSTVLFREPSAWEQYRWRIVLAIAALVLQTGLITGLYYEDRRRRIAEDNAHLLATELEQSNRLATAGELTASIAHEVRQPLTSIVVAAEAGLNWLGNKIPDLEEARSSLRNIIKEGHRVDDVVRNMVAMFRHQQPERVPVDINRLIGDVLMLVGRKIQASDIGVETEYAEDPIVLGNPVQFQQMLMNLIVNAIQAMNEHKGRDHVLRLRTETTGSPAQASIIVQDTGPGIASEQVENIFKPFFSTKSGGMGLGLAICKSIADAHGGTLTVAAGDQGGTVFKVVLPLDKGERS